MHFLKPVDRFSSPPPPTPPTPFSFPLLVTSLTLSISRAFTVSLIIEKTSTISWTGMYHVDGFKNDKSTWFFLNLIHGIKMNKISRFDENILANLASCQEFTSCVSHRVRMTVQSTYITEIDHSSVLVRKKTRVGETHLCR